MAEAGDAGPARDTVPLPQSEAALLVYTAIPFPLCVVDTAGRIVAMNPAALCFWGVSATAVLGSGAVEVLGLSALHPEVDGADPVAAAVAGTTERVPCRITTRDGVTHAAALVGARLKDGRYAVFSVVGQDTVPDWAYRDPTTGLANRLVWSRQQQHWVARAGAAAMFDLDDLKGVNDSLGHRAGDRLLALVGAVLRARTPADGLALRYGGDEFLVLLPGAEDDAAHRFCAEVCAEVAARGEEVVGRRPRLSAGSAPFGPGGLMAAVQQADENLYEAKGILLRAGSGTRLILTREGHRQLRPAAWSPPATLAPYAGRFTAEFDSYFRQVLARAEEQAQRFVAFATPEAEIAAVEVGAGSGRITFDGGLARRIGPRGQLVVTDPSEAQLQVARRRAMETGCEWVRFLTAPAESLPLASSCVDIVIGSTFLHFTDPIRAISEMARVLRPGGALALSTPIPWQWPPFWRQVVQPAYDEAARLGLPPRHGAVPEDTIRAALVAAGMDVERAVYEEDTISQPNPAIARAFVGQIHWVALILRGAPDERIQEVEKAVLDRIESFWDAFSPAERETPFQHFNLVARKRGG